MNRGNRRIWLLMLALASQPGCDARKQPQASASGSEPSGLVPLTNMVHITPGTFVRIKHPVTLTHDYWLAKYEVTQGEYTDLMRTNPSYFAGDPQRPVEKVTWFNAQAFCAELTRRERLAGRLPAQYQYRLPTEAEWEYACRAGTTNFYSFGDSTAAAGDYAWTSENASGTTHPVGQKRPNSWGLYDMHGNVWEWCSDWFAPYPGTALTNPVGPPGSAYKVFRGGGWNQAVEYARSRNRFMMSPTNGIHFVGFRVALSQGF
ncbi:MAG TPA: formylglycine-generating enzyme family protein [Verrucomicrobiae bacterium]